MEEKELIAKLKELKQIKPREDWVIFAKENIFKNEITVSSRLSAGERFSIILDIFPRLVRYLNYKYALATCLFAVLIFSTVLIYAKNALPGDTLFSLKKVQEEVRTLLASKSQLPQYQLEVANERLNELTRIVESKQGKKLAPAIKEFQASAKQAAINIKNIKSVKGLSEEIVIEAKKLEETKEKIQAMGVIIGDTEELEQALAELVEREIKDLETRTLTEKQTTELEEVKKDYGAKNYSSALEKLLLLTQENGKASEKLSDQTTASSD